MNALRHTNRRSKRPGWFRWLGGLGLFAVRWLITAGLVTWSFGAFYYGLPALGHLLAWLYLACMLILLLLIRSTWKRPAVAIGAFLLVLSWWLMQQPSNKRNWQPDVAELPWAEIQGDNITLHNIRNCEYRTDKDFTAQWETRVVRLSHITGVDLFINYWGSPWMAHPIASFQFSDAPPLCFSIETRKTVGQNYSAIGGLYRQYELIYVAADERDIVRVRTNIRKGEDVYLYHTKITPERARDRFLEYVNTINEMRDQPRWYNALTTNCTTSIRSQRAASKRLPWDWRILVNGKGDEMLFERDLIATDNLPFEELRRRAWINPAAQAADKSPDFSRLIRQGRPGFNLPADLSGEPLPKSS